MRFGTMRFSTPRLGDHEMEELYALQQQRVAEFQRQQKRERHTFDDRTIEAIRQAIITVMGGTR